MNELGVMFALAIVAFVLGYMGVLAAYKLVEALAVWIGNKLADIGGSSAPGGKR